MIIVWILTFFFPIVCGLLISMAETSVQTPFDGYFVGLLMGVVSVLLGGMALELGRDRKKRERYERERQTEDVVERVADEIERRQKRNDWTL